MSKKPLTVAWISDFPLEWLPDVPEPLKHLPRRHPATWQMVLLSEYQKDPALKIHAVMMRNHIERDFTFEQNGTTFHVLKAQPAVRLGTLFLLDTFLINRLFKKIQPDLVHAWGNEKAAGAIAHRFGHPYLITVQGLYGWYKERVPVPRYDRLMAVYERKSFRRGPVATAESKFAVNYLREHYPKLRVHQAEHAPNRAFNVVQRRPDTQPLHFISIGTLGFRKGTDLLFEALNRLVDEMDFKVSIVCNPNPDYLEQLRRQYSEKLWQRVTFKHHISPAEVARELETPTMLLLPTRADTSPNAVKEAAVAGVPVVASDVGGIPDYIVSGKNGLLFPPGKLETFVQVIREASRHPLFSRGHVDEQTLRQTRDYLSPERMAVNFSKAYQAALAASVARTDTKLAL